MQGREKMPRAAWLLRKKRPAMGCFLLPSSANRGGAKYHPGRQFCGPGAAGVPVPPSVAPMGLPGPDTHAARRGWDRDRSQACSARPMLGVPFPGKWSFYSLFHETFRQGHGFLVNQTNSHSYWSRKRPAGQNPPGFLWKRV